MEGASRSDVPLTVVHTTYRGRESLGRGHKQCFQERLLMFKKINIFYGVQGVTAEYPVTSKFLRRGVRIRGYEVAGTTPSLEIM